MIAIKWLIVLAVVGYGGLLALMYVFQRTLLYFPDAKRVAPAQAGLSPADEVVLTSSDDEKLIAWYVPAQGDRPIVIYFQGNAEGLSARVNRFTWLTADGTGLLALAYRGFGGSTGSPSEQGLILDARAAYDFVRARYPAKRIVLFGESLGTGVAVALASEHEISALILDAPYSSTVDVAAAHYWFAPVRWLMKDTFRSDERIGRVAAPILMMHGEQDRIIPIGFAEKLFALARGPKRMARFPQGGHVNLDDYGAAKVVKQFLAELS